MDETKRRIAAAYDATEEKPRRRRRKTTWLPAPQYDGPSVFDIYPVSHPHSSDAEIEALVAFAFAP